MDFRQWVNSVEDIGQIKTVTGADLETEIGVLTSLFQKEMEGPALLFDEIPGYPPGYRIVTNTMTSIKRIALTLGFSHDLKGLELIAKIREQLTQLRPLPLSWDQQGPLTENVLQGNDIDLMKIPVPKLHDGDGGRYLGTGCIVIMKDPETGWVNVGTYRVMRSDARTCTIHIVTGRHGWMIRNKYWQAGKPCPVAIATGVDPLLYLLSGMEMPWDANEMELAGGWRGESLNVIPGPTTGLPIPANAEFAVEGFMTSGKMLPEGPFGEWRGYYSKPGGEEPSIDISCMMHRHAPILVTSAPCIPPSDTTYPRGFFRAALVWHQLSQAGVPGITGCWILPSGGDRSLLVVRMKQLHPGHSKQVGMMAAFAPAFNYGGVMVVLVDDHIDITNLEQLFWALATSFNPDRGIEVIDGTWGNPLFKGQSSTPAGFSSRVIINATIPWENKDKVPALINPDPKLIEQVKHKWSDLFEIGGR